MSIWIFFVFLCGIQSGYTQFTILIERDTTSFLVVSPFGKDTLDPEDFVTTYDSFPDADAIIVKEGCQIIGKYGGIKKEVYRRTHILREGGLESANITFTYNKYRKSLDYIFARTQNLEGDSVIWTEVGEEDYFTDESSDGEAKISFAFPKARIGSIIDIAYGFTDKQQFYQSWTFQNEYPTLTSTFDVRESSLLRYNFYFQGSFKENLQKGRSDNRTVFVMKDIPPIREEPYVPCPTDYFPKVILQVSNVGIEGSEAYEQSSEFLNQDWQSFSTSFQKNKSTSYYRNKSKGLYKKVFPDLQEESDLKKKLEIIYERVRDHVRWNGSYSMAASDKVTKLYKREVANSGEINQLLIYFLRQAGLDVKPMLIATRTFGDPFQEFPMRNQFNTLVA
ncbi:MAG: DUF3857 domain-containing protein, partial [Bacteroidota bacterium]